MPDAPEVRVRVRVRRPADNLECGACWTMLTINCSCQCAPVVSVRSPGGGGGDATPIPAKIPRIPCTTCDRTHFIPRPQNTYLRFPSFRTHCSLHHQISIALGCRLLTGLLRGRSTSRRREPARTPIVHYAGVTTAGSQGRRPELTRSVAPAARRSSTKRGWPARWAATSGVRPRLSLASGSAPARSSALARLRRPRLAAL